MIGEQLATLLSLNIFKDNRGYYSAGATIAKGRYCIDEEIINLELALSLCNDDNNYSTIIK